MTTITLPRATVEQALEFLDAEFGWSPGEAPRIDALRAALEQQAEPVEPVATITECEACFTPDVCQLRGTCDYYTASQMRIAAPPQQAEAAQEPVAWYYERDTDKGLSFAPDRDPYKCWQPLTTPRPQRKPLTDEEIQAAWDSVDMRHPRGNETRIAFARAVERAHKIGEGA